VEEHEVYPCPHCEHIRLSQHEYHLCPNRPRVEVKDLYTQDWTAGNGDKVAYLRLTCRAAENRVKVEGRYCPGWKKLVERFHEGDKTAFNDCVKVCARWGAHNPAHVEAADVEFYIYQMSMNQVS